MVKTGWWAVKFNLTLEGEEVRFEDLSDDTKEHICECIFNGYSQGEIIEENDEE